MNEIRINDKISFIAASENPLSADIGIIRENGSIWLYDVGNGEDHLPDSGKEYNVVLSHFHQDHTGNINRIHTGELYLSKETYSHVLKGTIVNDSLQIGALRIFPLPSCHAKGCLGLEIDNEYAFVGDALYCRIKDGRRIYNAQLLKEEITVLKNMKASLLLVSHYHGMIRKKADVIDELEAIYQMRERNNAEISIRLDAE